MKNHNLYAVEFVDYDVISVNSKITYSHPFHRSLQQRHDKLLLGHLEVSPAWTFSKIYPSYYQNLNSRKTILTAGTSPLWCNSSFKNIIALFIHTYMNILRIDLKRIIRHLAFHCVCSTQGWRIRKWFNDFFNILPGLCPHVT